jgi:hypothetical protein
MSMTFLCVTQTNPMSEVGHGASGERMTKPLLDILRQ